MKSFWKGIFARGDIECFYPQYLGNLNEIPFKLLGTDNVISVDGSCLSTETIIHLADVTEKQLDKGEKSALIKRLLFKNISWNSRLNELSLNAHIDVTISRYFSYKKEQVKFVVLYIANY